jgi:hypothetical protein
MIFSSGSTIETLVKALKDRKYRVSAAVAPSRIRRNGTEGEVGLHFTW